jgi:hypothetical protein
MIVRLRGPGLASLASPVVAWSGLLAGRPAPIPATPSRARSLVSLAQPAALWSTGFRFGAIAPKPAAITLREAVRAWLAGDPAIQAIVGGRIYFAVPSQLAAYPCLAILVHGRTYGHNLAGADGTSSAAVQVAAFATRESDCIALIEAVRNFADGFRGPLATGFPVMACLLDDETDPMPVPPPDGSDGWIYQAAVDYRIRHRVPGPSSVTQQFA